MRGQDIDKNDNEEVHIEGCGSEPMRRTYKYFAKNRRMLVSKLENAQRMRNDVIYKTIVRDMKKFFIEDFNSSTNYIKGKRRKSPIFFYNCFSDYIQT